MALADLLKRLFGSKVPRFSAEDLRKSKPLRNQQVSYEILDDGAIQILAPLTSQGRGMLGAMARASKMPNEKKFELEPVGSFVWQLCDGSHNFETISRKLREEFKMSRIEADASLAAFLQMLHQRRLITVALPPQKKKK